MMTGLPAPVTANGSKMRRVAGACLVAVCLAAAGLGAFGVAHAAAPRYGGLGVATGGLVTTFFLESIGYEDSGYYYDENNNLQYATYTFHHGVDISGGCVAGAYPIYAAASGIVALAQYLTDGYGSQVIIDNGYNVGGNGQYTYTFYSHMGNRNTGQIYILVSPGQYVQAGDIIGYQGNDGSAWGSCYPDPGTHLDWEIRLSYHPLTYGPSMRYGADAASPNFYTYEALTCPNNCPGNVYVSPGPFPPGGQPTDTPVPPPQATWTPGPCGMRFTDLPDSHWAYQYVAYLYCRNVVSGYSDGTFRPNNASTRGQFTKMVVLGFGWTLWNPYWPSFNDVPPGSDFYEYVETAHLRGIINGYDDGSFRPGNPVTRAQATKMLVLAHQWTVIYPPNPSFWDVQPSHWAYGYVETARSAGIIGGFGDGSFRPDLVVSRAQLCKMLALTVQIPARRLQGAGAR